MAKKDTTAAAGGKIKSTAQHFDLDLNYIVSNDEQPRGQGVCPTLAELGYGVLARITVDAKNKPLAEENVKPCLWELLLSKDATKRAEGLALVKDNEPEMDKFATDLFTMGQAHAIGVRPALDGEGKDTGRWNIIFGMRRALARAIIHARTEGKSPATVRCILVDWLDSPEKLMLLAITENKSRKDQTPVDEAKHYQSLKKLGMNLQQVAEITGEDYQTVRNRLQILKLPQADQDKIHEGKLSWTRAIKKLAGKEGDGETAPKPGNNTEGGRRRMPTIKQVEPMYLALSVEEFKETVKDGTEEEFALVTEDVRKWMAHYAGFDYMSRADLRKKKKEDERAALLAEQARKAAAAQEEKETAAAGK